MKFIYAGNDDDDDDICIGAMSLTTKLQGHYTKSPSKLWNEARRT